MYFNTFLLTIHISSAINIMPAKCCFESCPKVGAHRLKLYLSEDSPMLGAKKNPRACEVHYQYVIICSERKLEPDFNLPISQSDTMNDENCEGFDVEYLDEYKPVRRLLKFQIPDLLIILSMFYAFTGFCLKTIFTLTKMVNQANVNSKRIC